MTIDTEQLFRQAISRQTESIDGGVSAIKLGTEPDFLFGPGGGDYVGINSYDARPVTSG